MRRTRLRPVSKKRARENRKKAPIRQAVFDRDGHRCRLLDLDSAHRCFGPPTPHHLLKDGQGGAYDGDNLVTLCAWGNDWVELEPDKARALGLVISAGRPTKSVLLIDLPDSA